MDDRRHFGTVANMTAKPSRGVPTSASLTYLKLSLVAMIWGGTFVAGRYLSADTPALLAASLRFMLAGITLAVFLVVTRKGFVKLNRPQLIKIIGLGFCGIYTYNLCFFYGLHYTAASRASLIVALNPAVMALFSYLFFREKLPALKSAGIALCLIGAAVVILNKSSSTLVVDKSDWRGDLLIFGCVLSWVAFSVFGKSVVKDIGALHTVTYSIFAGAAMLTATAIVTGQLNEVSLRMLTSSEFASLLYLGAVGSALAYIWYYKGIEQIGATRAGVFIALNPLTAVLLGALLLGERVNAATVMGGALIIAGIIICNRPITAQYSLKTASARVQ